LAPIEPSTGGKVNDRRRILDLKGISKAFAGKRALADVSLSLDEGQVIGLVGENGAVKSTPLKIISRNLRADSVRSPCVDAKLSFVATRTRIRSALSISTRI
jgi:methyl-galactoside transport system ATP-binding protein